MKPFVELKAQYLLKWIGLSMISCFKIFSQTEYLSRQRGLHAICFLVPNSSFYADKVHPGIVFPWKKVNLPSHTTMKDVYLPPPLQTRLSFEPSHISAQFLFWLSISTVICSDDLLACLKAQKGFSCSLRSLHLKHPIYTSMSEALTLQLSKPILRQLKSLKVREERDDWEPGYLGMCTTWLVSLWVLWPEQRSFAVILCQSTSQFPYMMSVCGPLTWYQAFCQVVYPQDAFNDRTWKINLGISSCDSDALLRGGQYR